MFDILYVTLPGLSYGRIVCVKPSGWSFGEGEKKLPFKILAGVSLSSIQQNDMTLNKIGVDSTGQLMATPEADWIVIKQPPFVIPKQGGSNA